MEIKQFLSKNKTLIFLILTLVMQFVPNQGYLPWGGMWMRLQTQNIPLLESFAQDAVYTFYKNQVLIAINEQKEELQGQDLNKIFEEEFQKLLEEKKDEVNKQIEETAGYLKEALQYEENGKKYTILPDIDPYQYIRLARNYLNYGRLGDAEKDGKSWDTKILAPIGRQSSDDRELQPYLLAYLYKTISFFKPEIPLLQATAYFPIIFVTLAIMFAFLFVKKLTNNTGGLFAATILSTATAGVSRTQWGHADTDAYNLFFPMLISWLFVASIQAENTRKKYALILLNSFTIAVYAFAWTGWWYIFDFILAALGIQIIYTTLFNRQKIKQSITTFAAYFIGTAIFYKIINYKLTDFIMDVTGPFKFGLIKEAAHATQDSFLLPNVYTTVAELNPPSVTQIANNAGGMLILAFGILGLILLLTKNNLPRRDRVTYTTFILLWTLSTMYASTKGIRFTLLVVPVSAALFGISAGAIESIAQQINTKTIKIKQSAITAFIILIFAILITKAGQVDAAYSSSINDIPILNKAMWNALTKIKNNSTQDAIITSWWDFGHHFKYVADRAVTFDGAHQNSPMAHWVGKILTTNNETEAIGLLRMLNCGSRKAYDTLQEQTSNDTLKTIEILNEIILINKKEEAKKYLENKNLSDTEKILQYTHCKPPESYFITSQDMTGKAGVWSHFGLWDFKKAYAWITLKNTPKQHAIQEMTNKLKYTKEQAEQTYKEMQELKSEEEANTWISGWPAYTAGPNLCITQNQNLQCENGAVINTLAEQNSSGHRKGETTMDVKIRLKTGTRQPRYFSYIDEKSDKFIVKEYKESQAPFAIILAPSGNAYRALIASPEHVDSMYTRLFYLDGYGLEHFKKFDTQHALVNGEDTIVWKIHWRQNAE